MDKIQVEELIKSGYTKASQFAGCLCRSAPMSGDWLESHDDSPDDSGSAFIRLGKSSLPSLAFALPASAESVSDSANCARAEGRIDPDYLIDTIPAGFAQEMEIRLRDICVDRSIVLYLRDVHGLLLQSDDWDVIQMRRARTTQNTVSGVGCKDPCILQERVPGVDALYEVARIQYGPLIAGGVAQDPPSKEVVEAFVRRNSKLFNKNERAVQAARLTRLVGSRNQGLQDGMRRDFTRKAKDILQNEYSMRGTFVSESLALIVHATKQWLNFKADPPPGLSVLSALKDELQSYGFNGVAELEAIFAFITWTDKRRFSRPPESA
ncbi:MAG TPA: hypothetical protein VK753_09615 [Xanthomonadaceae bacterium]|nr:hypothetical protein [Xanthomonadaceae bacterium]